jgi:hypothetical protein
MSTDMKPIPRSMLFTPATKASYFGKAADVDADAVILTWRIRSPRRRRTRPVAPH